MITFESIILILYDYSFSILQLKQFADSNQLHI